MPLLKRKAFEKSSVLEFLRDDEEVFHCEITDEIFRDYEEYCERIILVNSMVWSCEMTGKPNLTYTEALESEKNARKSLRDFPMELRIPILYLASRTKRCTFAEMQDDVFNFVRDRYFTGETVEACLEGDSWSEGQILLVTAPKQLPDVKGSPVKPSSMYCYEVEQFGEEVDGNGMGRVAIVPHDRVRRSRGVFTREKNKLYLKQFVEQGPMGVIRIKETMMLKYNISKVKFDQIFSGNPPEFPSSKKFDKITNVAVKGKLTNGQKKLSPDKKRQESISKYITKIDKFEGTKQSKTMEVKNKLSKLDHKSGKIQKHKNGIADSKNLKDEMKRVGEELKQKKLEEKIKKKEKSLKLAAYLKEWNKQKDDLELEDHNALPRSIPVEIPGLPNKYFGDFMAILEFFQEFAKPLKLRDAFHNGLDMEILRRALVTKEVAGPLSDIVQVLLGAIFSLQEDEAEEYNEDRDIQDVNNIQETSEDIGMTAMRGIQLATAASKWPQTYMATPLSQLPIDSQTFSEVLRLHLLSSGSSGGDRCMKWRYQQRGGYSSQDDPGLWLRIMKPHVIKALSRKHLTQLPLSYKLTIINCLINQILSYATIRDLIEEKLEKSKNLKYDIRNLQVAERKREAEIILARQKIKRDATAKKEEEKLVGDAAKALDQEVQEKLEALLKETELKKADYEKKLRNMQSECFNYQSYLGCDRAHRRYWVYETISGLFIEHDERFNGICMDKPVTPNPSLATAPPEDTLSYVQKLFENEHGGYSDKENDSENALIKKVIDAGKSPKKNYPENNITMMQDLLMCTANHTTCPVHSSQFPKTRWAFLYSPEHVDSLIAALNKRGIRENDLRQTMDLEKELIVKYITKCPVSQLNPIHAPPAVKPEMQTRLTRRYVDANLRFPPGTDISEVLEMSLRDAVVDLEEKLFMGCLGELQIKDRQTWREIIMKRGYDKQCNNLTWGPQRTLTDDLHLINGKTKVDPETNAAAYKEPGYFLGAVGTEVVSDEDNEATSEENPANDDLPVVKDLASALLQLGQAVSQKYLKRPLGYDEKERAKESKTPLEFDAMRRWETSLMECSSFAQVMLHLVILDNSILWSKSILNANCRICRRRTDAENMLLCDSCNKGHHMYCLKPKLTKVPEGDWFCDQCKPKEKTPQKRNRKVFKEEDSSNELDDSNSWDGSVTTALCTSCGSGGALIQCSVCDEGWHSECLTRPPARRAIFTCPACSKPKHKNNREMDRRVRRCAADAMTNINHYSKMLMNSSRHQSDSDSSEETTAAKTKRKRPSKDSSPIEQVNGVSKKARRSAPVIHSESGDEPSSATKAHKKKVSKETSHITNGVTNGGSHGKRSSKQKEDTTTPRRASAPNVSRLLLDLSRKSNRRSEAIHQDILEELLAEVMKHKDSWPFNAPVTVEEVPDYFEVITEPMDFGTIKTKIARKKYATDSQFMADCALVFNNCFVYNQEDDAVAKAGSRLHKFFDKRCKELNIIGLPSNDAPLVESSKKKNRTLN